MSRLRPYDTWSSSQHVPTRRSHRPAYEDLSDNFDATRRISVPTKIHQMESFPYADDTTLPGHEIEYEDHSTVLDDTYLDARPTQSQGQSPTPPLGHPLTPPVGRPLTPPLGHPAPPIGRPLPSPQDNIQHREHNNTPYEPPQYVFDMSPMEEDEHEEEAALTQERQWQEHRHEPALADYASVPPEDLTAYTHIPPVAKQVVPLAAQPLEPPFAQQVAPPIAKQVVPLTTNQSEYSFVQPPAQPLATQQPAPPTGQRIAPAFAQQQSYPTAQAEPSFAQPQVQPSVQQAPPVAQQQTYPTARPVPAFAQQQAYPTAQAEPSFAQPQVQPSVQQAPPVAQQQVIPTAQPVPAFAQPQVHPPVQQTPPVAEQAVAPVARQVVPLAQQPILPPEEHLLPPVAQPMEPVFEQAPAPAPAPSAAPAMQQPKTAPSKLPPGLTPEELEYADVVDAALTRQPSSQARMLSLAVGLFFLVLVIWASLAKVDEVTKAEGQVISSQRTQSIQNLEGGILRAILVREGQIIEKDAPLARLDNELAESSYRDATNKSLEHRAAILRLEAELENREPEFPDDLMAASAQIIQDQKSAYAARKNQRESELMVLASQAEQRAQDVEEQLSRKRTLDRNLELAIEQRNTALPLVQRKNYSRMDFLGLEQKVASLQGDVDSLASSLPKAQAAAQEAQQRIVFRRAELDAAITDEINKRRNELASLRETLAAGSDRVTRTELRSPVRGTVKQIYINSIGGVVKPGESIMDIVPLDDTLLVEAKVRPADVAFLHPNQRAMVKFSAYDFAIYGGLEATLEQISADTIEDKKGEVYYLAKLRTQRNAINYRHDSLPIIPGMLATVDILTGQKTILDYVMKPILKARQNALRER